MVGLRQTKTRRTKDAIVDAALDLFQTVGYDRTRMEQIAEAAEVGTTTLYRYFPNKEAIVLEPFVSRVGRMARAVDESAPGDDLETALGRAVQRFFETDPRSDAAARAAEQIIAGAPGPRARLWDVAAQERALLEDAVGRRLGSDPDGIDVALACRNTMLVVDLTEQRWTAGGRQRQRMEIAGEIIDAIRRSSPTVPRLG